MVQNSEKDWDFSEPLQETTILSNDLKMLGAINIQNISIPEAEFGCELCGWNYECSI